MNTMKAHRYTFSILVVLVALVALPLAAQAQDDRLNATYTSEDGMFAFDYPGMWTPDIFDDGSVNLYSYDVSVDIYIYGPFLLEELGYDLTDPLDELLEQFLAEYDEAIPGDDGVVDVTLDDIDALRLGFVYEESDYSSGLLGVPLGEDELPAIVEYYYQDEDDLELIDAIAASLRVPGEAGETDEADAAGMDATDGADALTSYDAAWEDAIEELQAAGVIPAGGGLIFTEDYAYFTGQGNFYTPLARTVSEQDVVIAAELTYTASGSDDLESCSLGARVVWDESTGNSNRYLDAGLLGSGNAFYLDQQGDEGEFDTSLDTFDLDEPHHILIILIDDALTVYIDGELVFEDAPVEARAGSFGVGLNGKGAGANCEARSIWAYRVTAE